MKKKYTTHFIIFFVFVVVLNLAVFISAGNAQDWSRGGKSEIFAFGQYMRGDETVGDVFDIDIKMELDDTIAGGIGYGYNFNDHFNLNMDIFYGKSEIKANALDESLKADTDMLGFDFNVDVNFLKNRITPMITGGFGWITFKGDVEGIDFDETDFSYNVGGGIRWDISDHFLIKAVYRSLWTKLEDTDDSLRLDVIAFNIGYIF